MTYYKIECGSPKRLLTLEEVAAVLGISPRTIYNGTGRKAKNPFPIKPRRVGRLLRFDIRDVESYIESLKDAA
ncbi:helix-turn-helix transcriptional regulator [Syntrophus buswellii]|uniref:helix-turn-helix transcriptional regulator n=1 Tax=Syntrophus buswellii TaxID=43774 RepID=UPI0038D37503